MWPRRDGRGDERWRGIPGHHFELQCGRGAMAAVTLRPHRPTLRSSSASMWPRRDGRGDDVTTSDVAE